MVNWIKGAIKHPGALRKTLRIKKGKKIPAAKLAVKKRDSAKTKRRKNLAKLLRTFK